MEFKKVLKFANKIFWSFIAQELIDNLIKRYPISLFSASVPGDIAVLAAKEAQDPAVLAVREQGSNHGVEVEKYLQACGLKGGYPWCQAFVIYRLIQAAHHLNKSIPLDFPRSASCRVVSDWGKKNALWFSRADVELGKATPQPGDLVYYWFPLRGIGHTGIVVDIQKNGFWTVEGNTGPSGADKVIREGEGVYKKFRTYKALGLYGGFVRFPY